MRNRTKGCIEKKKASNDKRVFVNFCIQIQATEFSLRRKSSFAETRSGTSS